MTCAPAGTSTLAPTAAILPSRMTSVPFSMGAPASVKIFACVRATVEGGCVCAEAPRDKMQTAAASVAKRRTILMLFTEHLRKRRPFAVAWAFLLASFRLAWRRAFCQFQWWHPAFSLQLSFLFPSALSFL